MPVAPGQAIKRIAQRARLVFVTGVRRKINVEPGHLVEPDDTLGRPLGEVADNPVGKFGVAAGISDRAHRHHDHLEAIGNLATPFQRIDPYRVSARLTGKRNAHEVTLQATVGEIFVEAKSELHQLPSPTTPGGGSTPRGRL